MLLTGKNILIISPEAWGVNYVSKHHYSVELSKKNNVFFLNPPSDRFERNEISSNLEIVDYVAIRGVTRLPDAISGLIIKWSIGILEKKLDVSFDIIWNFDSSRFFNLKYLKSKFRICHIVDMAENIKRPVLAETADLCLCTSDFIHRELSPFNSNVYKIHHGYSSERKKQNVKDEFSDKIQVGYIGNLSRLAIDWESIFKMIELFPHCQFNFIGNYDSSNLSKKPIEENVLKNLKSYQNVRLLGAQQSSLIPNYLEKFDILLCAYKVENEGDIKQHSNLHKLMEYLGSGKVIVSSYSYEYRNEVQLLEMANDRKDIVDCFDKVINNLGYYNSSEKQKERRLFAQRYSYANNIKKIEQILSNYTPEMN
ncbi:glycosyltransferase family protein [Reichenbachiella versicolor]|uniref:hypothetical protein n=1 Tax=Reichenbachiella versicolor TaxID=1821036 RepID=UPI000D6DF94E|nr:hypothetical protein [Reichenbachiella versicolor]